MNIEYQNLMLNLLAYPESLVHMLETKFLRNRNIYSCDILTIIEYHLFPFIRQSMNSLIPKRASLASEKVGQPFFDFTLVVEVLLC